MRTLARRRTTQIHVSLSAYNHAPGHVGMDRAAVIVSPGLIESTAKACSRQQEIRTRCAVIVLQPMRRAIVIGPGDALARSYRDLRRREREVDDRNFHFFLCHRRMHPEGREAEDERGKK